MTRPLSRTMLVTLLLASLAMFCLSDLARAAAPSGELMGCASLLCDEASGCGTTVTKLVAPPVAAVAALLVLTTPAPMTMPLLAAEPPASPGRQVVPVGPRSPPVA
ncbi:MAG: hypothetical protein ACREK6_01935 [Candidatus Rokuibacteriota bacterium]